LVGLISSYIEHFTYAGLFVVLLLCGLGLPMPEDVALLAGGYLVHKGIIRYPITIGVSLVGVVAGDNSLYFIGRHAGSRLLSYFGLSRPGSGNQVERMQDFMHRHGHLAIFYARFLAGLRAVIYLSAGSLGVSPSRFLFYDLLGAVISVPLVVTLGYLFGGEIERAIHYVGGFEKLIWLVAALCAGIYLTRLAVLQRASGEKT
jgi:membrane protein DedA with SNARE-associated domain